MQPIIYFYTLSELFLNIFQPPITSCELDSWSRVYFTRVGLDGLQSDLYHYWGLNFFGWMLSTK